MRISTFWYCLRQGFKNINRNKMFSIASIATISACIFLFCLFYSIIVNFQYIVENAEKTIGITVFFDEELDEEEILVIGDTIAKREGVLELKYTSASMAWENFKSEYFSGMENLAEGFAEDNPLAGSASYEVFLKDINMQEEFVTYLKGISGVRRVDYSSVAASGLSSFNKMIGYLSAIIIGVLLAVSVFLISNTISIAISVRREEIRIMKLIGATNFMIRAPFVVEGVLIGLLGTVIPLVTIYYVYENGVRLILEKFHILSNVIVFLPIKTVGLVMFPVSLLLGAGIGLLGSITSAHRHLRV